MLRKCPFCGKEVKTGFPTLDYNKLAGKWMLTHWCAVSILITGDTEKECIDKWNGVYEVEES